jgi:hypothetical protein
VLRPRLITGEAEREAEWNEAVGITHLTRQMTPFMHHGHLRKGLTKQKKQKEEEEKKEEKEEEEEEEKICPT